MATDKSKTAEYLCYCNRCNLKTVVATASETTKPTHCSFCGKSDAFVIDKSRTPWRAS